MAYYHDLVTEKSWKLLQELKRKTSFILIGGWAVFLHAKTLKSKDIDIIVDFNELDELRTAHDLRKNERLKKYEITVEEIDVDIYVPFFSDLGVPIEEIQKSRVMREGFSVPSKEVLLALKIKAYRDRGHSSKGEKDKIDIVSLLASGIEYASFRELLARCDLLEYLATLRTMLSETKELPELRMNAHQYSRLKKTVLLQIESSK